MYERGCSGGGRGDRGDRGDTLGGVGVGTGSVGVGFRGSWGFWFLRDEEDKGDGFRDEK